MSSQREYHYFHLVIFAFVSNSYLTWTVFIHLFLNLSVSTCYLTLPVTHCWQMLEDLLVWRTPTNNPPQKWAFAVIFRHVHHSARSWKSQNLWIFIMFFLVTTDALYSLCVQKKWLWLTLIFPIIMQPSSRSHLWLIQIKCTLHSSKSVLKHV